MSHSPQHQGRASPAAPRDQASESAAQDVVQLVAAQDVAVHGSPVLVAALAGHGSPVPEMPIQDVTSSLSAAPPEVPEDHIVYALSKLLNHMAKATEFAPGKSSCFQSVRLPKVSLSSYASRIQKYFRCTEECFVLCLVYIDRIVKLNPDIQISELTCHRLLLTSATVAAKFHDDEYASNEYFARVGGIDNKELNILEADFLKLLQWKLCVSATEYEWYLEALCGIR